MAFLQKLIRWFVFKTGKAKRFYIRFCHPSGREYAEFLKKWGHFYHIGKNCHIWPYTNVTDPEYVYLGDNVMLTACTLLGHDGSIAVLNIAYQKKLDRVGKIKIKNNVFVGHGVIILPGITIGNNVIIGAGSIVTKDIPDGVIVVGNPAKIIGNTEELVRKLELQTQQLPWSHLIQQREGSFDPDLEPELKQLRIKYFFDSEQ
ncbi:MAG: hypothetical protein RL637_228 [Pseudomonadota bacterium]|jgi:acetyltransferase-like isoleucine patch superfamily enzyme